MRSLLRMLTEEPLEFEGRHVFQIGHQLQSCTKDPGFYPLDEEATVFMADAPGFGDSDIFSEIPNITLIYEILKVASHVTLVLNMRASSL